MRDLDKSKQDNQIDEQSFKLLKGQIKKSKDERKTIEIKNTLSSYQEVNCNESVKEIWKRLLTKNDERLENLTNIILDNYFCSNKFVDNCIGCNLQLFEGLKNRGSYNSFIHELEQSIIFSIYTNTLHIIFYDIIHKTLQLVRKYRLEKQYINNPWTLEYVMIHFIFHQDIPLLKIKMAIYDWECIRDKCNKSATKIAISDSYQSKHIQDLRENPNGPSISKMRLAEEELRKLRKDCNETFKTHLDLNENKMTQFFNTREERYDDRDDDFLN